MKFMNMLKTTALLVFIVLGTFLAAPFASQNDSTQPAVVIDVRTEAEWNEGHLEGAMLIPYDRIETGIATAAVDKKARIYLYCRTGRRTGIAFDVLKKAGYQDLVNLETLEKASKTLNRAIVK
jgi:phage shock protein E